MCRALWRRDSAEITFTPNDSTNSSITAPLPDFGPPEDKGSESSDTLVKLLTLVTLYNSYISVVREASFYAAKTLETTPSFILPSAN